jgi:hypothetical protein
LPANEKALQMPFVSNPAEPTPASGKPFCCSSA